MSQYFVQDGAKIEIPAPTFEGLPNSSAITPEYCDNVFTVFDDVNRFNDVGGWPALNNALGLPMVLVMSIWDDVRLPSPRLGDGLALTCRSTTPTCCGSTPPTRPRRREARAPLAALAPRTLASPPTSSRRCPTRT